MCTKECVEATFNKRVLYTPIPKLSCLNANQQIISFKIQDSILLKPICRKQLNYMVYLQYKTFKIAHNNREVHRNIQVNIQIYKYVQRNVWRPLKL